MTAPLPVFFSFRRTQTGGQSPENIPYLKGREKGGVKPIAVRLYFYANKSSYGDWFEFVHRVRNEFSHQAIKGSEIGKSYRLGVRKDYNLDDLPIREGDILVCECDEAWVDLRDDYVKLGLIRVKNPIFSIKDGETEINS